MFLTPGHFKGLKEINSSEIKNISRIRKIGGGKIFAVNTIKEFNIKILT